VPSFSSTHLSLLTGWEDAPASPADVQGAAAHDDRTPDPWAHGTWGTAASAHAFASPALAALPADPSAGDPSWRLDALCAETDPEAFFPEKGGSTREAKRVCSGCAVRTECLEYALANDERFGIWGGLSERERRRVRLARRMPLSA
jgi:WhiB family transcriptional regulator, redox-sensing transcriptional regulator